MKVKNLCLTFILGAFLSACGSSSPEDVALEFTEKTFKGDKEVLNYLDLEGLKESEKEFVNGKIRASVAEQKEKADKKGGVKKIIIGEKDIKENAASIETITIFKDDSNTTEYVKFIKKDGKWLIKIK